MASENGIKNAYETSKVQQEIDYAKFLNIILSRWYWIAFSLVLSLLFAKTYLWYTQKKYSTVAYLKFEEKQSDLTSFVQLQSIGRNYTNKILSESWNFKSKKTITDALNLIDYKVSYFIAGRIRTSDLYPNKPFKLQILKQDSITFYDKLISIKGEGKKFLIEYKIGNKEIKKTYAYNTPIEIPGVTFYIDKNTPIYNNEYNFKFNHKNDFFGRLSEGLNIVEAAKFSSVAMITKTDYNPYFAADGLNAIIKVYLQQDLALKTQSAKQIIDFIDAQLNNLSNSVKSSGEKLKNFKQDNNFIDLSNATESVLTKVTELETQNRSYELQLLVLKQLQNQLSKNGKAMLNFNLDGNVDPLLVNLISQFNSLIQERLSMLSTYKENSPLISDIDKKMAVLQNAAYNNIASTLNRILKQKEYNKAELDKAYASLNTLPKQERLLFGLQRDYDINEKIYSYLSEKKLEAQIGKASVLSGASLIDAAQPNTSPISPNTNSVWQMAWIIGIGMGLGVIFLVRSINDKIYDKEKIESLTNTPIIGMIRNYPYQLDSYSSQILSIAKPKSLFAESVRSVRTNLSFIANDKESKVISITSEVAGEGKSFVSVNLASTMALIDKKVILIAADLRRSKVHRTFNIKNKIGLSTYLSKQNTLDEVIIPSNQPNMDLMIAGHIPPNPAELMYTNRLVEMITELRKRYDYIIFDTAPIGLVSDALPLIRMSDINLFVIRAGKSKFSAANIPDRISNEYKLKNSFIVLNDYKLQPLYSRYYTSLYNDNYYGYYYSDVHTNGQGYYTDDIKVSKLKSFTSSIFKLLKKENS
ncbi:MAG: polysaccharide biosynthesis tyrosine autokinase [Sphingobacteriales bacterium]|nr:MAG: polysaccharide biosynthesis tyrosine autokinase [Sphingobacteriales bacterium]